MALESVNPATGAKIHSYEEISPEERGRLLELTAKSFAAWKRVSLAERGNLMKKAASILRQKTDALAKLMAEEMGKPVSQGRSEIEKCAVCCDFYAGQAAKFLAPEIVATEAKKSYAAFEPLGTVLAIMPWNFPFWQVIRAAAPALMAGNVMALKHAANVTGCSIEIEKIFKEAGFPEGVFVNLIAGIPQVVTVIEHPAVKAVTLTGSVAAGKAVAAQAGKVLKKTVLELGGSDAYLILEDADVDAAARTCGQSRLINGGQSCIAAKRFIVVEKNYDRFVKGLVEFMGQQKMGDPLDETVTVGPLARKEARDGIHRQVEQSLNRGAKLLLGGKIPSGPGAYYPPTVLGDVKKGMPVFDEEVFGPVAAVIKVRDEKEAVRTANDSVFGLGGAVFTRDTEKGERIAREELKCGAAFVNTFVRSDARLPFGGIEQSGYGRELGIFGIREFVNIKTVYID